MENWLGMKKKNKHPTGCKPMTSQLTGRHSRRCATTAATQRLKVLRPENEASSAKFWKLETLRSSRKSEIKSLGEIASSNSNYGPTGTNRSHSSKIIAPLGSRLCLAGKKMNALEDAETLNAAFEQLLKGPVQWYKHSSWAYWRNNNRGSIGR